MSVPPLVYYQTPADYKRHYEKIYCHGRIMTFDSIRVYFKSQKFGHAFYESSTRDGKKDIFSYKRAERINWIKLPLSILKLSYI